ncbi:MAG: GAF and ANTAR domain-containing protein, partial [Aeromicrobium sp.]
SWLLRRVDGWPLRWSSPRHACWMGTFPGVVVDDRPGVSLDHAENSGSSRPIDPSSRRETRGAWVQVTPVRVAVENPAPTVEMLADVGATPAPVGTPGGGVGMNVPENADALWHQRYTEAEAQIAGADAAGLGAVAGSVRRLHLLCRSLTANLPAMGAAVNLVQARGTEAVAAASDDRSRDIDQLQFTTGEGPCHDAFAARRPVLIRDLQSEARQRWPAFTSAASAAGVAAVFAFPLHIGAVGFGILDVYAEQALSLSPEQVAMVLTYAQIATEILLGGDLTTASGERAVGSAKALDYRAEIHQALGMAMVGLRVGPAEALIWMRAHASDHDRTLISLAREIITGFDMGEADDD